MVFMVATLLVLASSSVVLCEPSNVKFAAVLFRHGARTPVNPYPTDPYRNTSYWPVPFGELTNTGKLQHYRLGGWLRQRYQHLLSQRFQPTEIFLLSTDMDRTLMSTLANSAGLYPPSPVDLWNPDLHWQPIPVHTVPEEEDEVLAMNKPCRKYKAEMLKYKESEPYKKTIEKYRDLMQEVGKYSGSNITSLDDMVYVYTTLAIEQEYNLTLPKWTRSLFPDKMREPACLSFKIPTATPLLARLKAGPLLKQITSNMVALANGSEGARKVYVYGAHDTTIGNMLNALGVFDLDCPAFTATVFLELIQDGSDYFVRVSYRNSVEIVEPKVLSIPSCGQLCPLQQFQELYKDLISVDWDSECAQPSVIPLLIIVFTSTLLMVVYYFMQIQKHAVVEMDKLKFNNGYKYII